MKKGTFTNKYLRMIYILFAILILLSGLVFYYSAWVLPYAYIIGAIDRSHDKKIMVYDLGDNRYITCLKKDTVIYIIPYAYDNEDPPDEDFIALKRRYDSNFATIYFKNDSTLLLYERNKTAIVNFEKYKCEYVTDMIHYSYVDDSLYPRFGIIEPRRSPLEISVRRIEGGRVTYHSYKGITEIMKE